MKNSKLITAGILILTFLFVHSMQRNIFGYASSTGYKMESAVNRTLTGFTGGVEQAERLICTSVLVVINKATLAIYRLMDITVGPLAMNTQINAIKEIGPCILMPKVPAAPAAPCHHNILIDRNPGLINPRIAGLGIVS